MRRLSRLAVLAVLTAGLLAASAAPAIAGGGSCSPYLDGNVVPVPCSALGGSSGSPGGHGSSIAGTCTITRLDRAQATGLGLAWPPPPSDSWALLTCFGGTSRSAPQAGLVSNATGAPQVTPRQLLQQALGELRVPYLDPDTAPPRGKDGLVGLPEWFWIAGCGLAPEYCDRPRWARVGDRDGKSVGADLRSGWRSCSGRLPRPWNRL